MAPLFQPYPRSAASGGDERDPGFFEGAGDGGEIVPVRITSAFFEINNDVSGYRRSVCERRLIHIDESSGGSALFRRNGHFVKYLTFC